MDLIALDKKAAQAVQKRFGLSNYQMLNLSWVFGFGAGVVATLFLHWLFSPHYWLSCTDHESFLWEPQRVVHR